MSMYHAASGEGLETYLCVAPSKPNVGGLQKSALWHIIAVGVQERFRHGSSGTSWRRVKG